MIQKQLEEMFSFASMSKDSIAADGAGLLTTNLCRRLDTSPPALQPTGDEVSKEVSKEAWVKFAQGVIDSSAYTAEDPPSKVIGALQRTLLSKAEYDIFKADFDKNDGDGDGFLSEEEIKPMLKLQLERDPTDDEIAAFIDSFDRNNDKKISFDEYMQKLCGKKWDVVGLSDEEAMQGFIADLAKIPVTMCRAGLAAEEFKGKEEELAKMSDEAVREAFTSTSLGVWAQMADDPDAQGQVLEDVMGRMKNVAGADGEKIKELMEGLAT